MPLWNRENRVTKKCLVCNKEFSTLLCKTKKGQGKYCSKKCMGIAQTGKGNSNWKSGKIIKTNGYIMLKIRQHPSCNCDGYIYEHRIIMEKHIGRYLKPTEIIHHINGNRADNRLKNLLLFPNQSAHTLFHKHHKNIL